MLFLIFTKLLPMTSIFFERVLSLNIILKIINAVEKKNRLCYAPFTFLVRDGKNIIAI